MRAARGDFLLEHARQLLAPGGALLVVTPDFGSVARLLLRKRWWHFRLAHVGYFDARSLNQACTRARLRVTRRHPAAALG